MSARALCMLAALLASSQAQPIPVFPKRPAPLAPNQIPGWVPPPSALPRYPSGANASAVLPLSNHPAAIPVTPSIFIFSLNDVLPLHKSNRCTSQVDRAALLATRNVQVGRCSAAEPAAAGLLPTEPLP
jgi:hypothetical protein